MSGDSGQRRNITAEATIIKTVIAKAPVRAQRTRGVLTVTGGGEVGRVISVPVGEATTLGRAEEATVRFADVSLSRIHARLMRLGDEWVVTDSGSTNGTYVNDVRVDKSATLKDGDRLQLGSDTTLRFSLVDSAEETALRKVYEAAMRDALTGVFNRKHLDERIDGEIEHALRHQQHLSLVMMDIDFFKRVNDTHGHPAGDAVLRLFGSILLHGVRAEDVVARYGGEEFTILLRGTDAYNACLLADRLRWVISQTPVAHGGAQIWVTASAGVASLLCCGEQHDKATLVGLADRRLYQAKEGGRNRVVGAG